MALPTLRQLQYLVTLADTLHFGMAAERCFVSQSTFSTGISELENTIGAKLFERDNKNVRLNALGQQLVSRAQLIVRDINDLMSISQQYTKLFAAPLQLGIIPSILPFMLTPIMQHVRQHLPEATLSIHELQTETALHALSQGQVDMVLMALPYNTEGFSVTPWFSEPLYWVGHADIQPEASLLAKGFKHLDLAQLILLEEGHCLRDHTLSACPTNKLKALSALPDKTIQANSLLTLLELVQHQFGFTFLPQMALASRLLASYPQVRCLPVLEAPCRDIVLVSRKANLKSPELVLLTQTLAQIPRSIITEP